MYSILTEGRLVCILAVQDVKFRLEERLNQTSRWREELQEELQANKKETQVLQKCLMKLKKALIKTDEPMRVNSECQNYRKSRKGIERIADAVEESLENEVDCIRDYQQRMKQLVEQMVRQAETNYQAQKGLVSDLRNKKMAAKIDATCCSLTQRSGEIERHSRVQD